MSVVPWRTTSSIRLRHFCWKLASPTDSTSSTNRMSGSRKAAMEKPSRICMPREKNLTWRSMASLSPANSTISSNRSRVILRRMPEHGTVEEDVLAAGQVGMDAAGHAEERPEAALHLARAGRLVRDPADDLEQGGLPGAVDADEPQRPSRFDL